MATLSFPEGFPFTKRTDMTRAAPAHGQGQAAARAKAQAAHAAPAPAGAVATPPRERRRAPRQTLVAKATVGRDEHAAGPGAVAAVFLSNISMNGVAFHARRPLEIGGTYRISIDVGPMKWSSRLRVVSCHEHESGTYDIGGEFIVNELARRGMAA